MGGWGQQSQSARTTGWYENIQDVDRVITYFRTDSRMKSKVGLLVGGRQRPGIDCPDLAAIIFRCEVATIF
jgi:hypothetical protein